MRILLTEAGERSTCAVFLLLVDVLPKSLSDDGNKQADGLSSDLTGPDRSGDEVERGCLTGVDPTSSNGVSVRISTRRFSRSDRYGQELAGFMASPFS